MFVNTLGTLTVAATLALGTQLAYAAGPVGQSAGDQANQAGTTTQAGQAAPGGRMRQDPPTTAPTMPRQDPPATTPGTPRTPSEPCTTCTAPTIVPATETEAANLTYMREEEKLARDLYIAFEGMWENGPFARVAASEQQHMDAMLRLLLKYQLTDPVASLPVGDFASADMDALYAELLAQGKVSEVDALLAAAKLEEVDIYDNLGAKGETDKPDLARAFDSLACGSRNHLRTFAGAWSTVTGKAYTAAYLPTADVTAILAAPMERCGGAR